MKIKWNCYFKNPPETITVGQKLLLLCDGEPKNKLQNPVRIEFLDKKHDYSLYVLKTLKTENNFLALEVTSYRIGQFKYPFVITDGEQGFAVEDLSFTVQSVIGTKQDTPKAYGPFGPFAPSLPLWFLLITIFSLVCLFISIFVFIKRLLKRKAFVQLVLNRKTYLDPSKFFILGLRKQTKNSDYSIKKLEMLFKSFLEDLFFIPAKNKTTIQIMKNLKKNQNLIYKKEGQNLQQILNELSSVDHKTINEKTFINLKKVCQNIVFLLDQKGQKK